MRTYTAKSILLFYLLLSFFTPSVSFALLSNPMILDGEIYDLSGTPLANTTVDFTLTVKTDAACSLYQESHSITTNLNGGFTINLGQGTGKSAADTNFLSNPDLIFSNSTTACGLNITPQARVISLQFSPDGGFTNYTLNDQLVGSSGSAASIGGYTASDFVKLNTLPTSCAGGTVLTWTGTSFSCVTDNVGSATGTVTSVSSANSYLSVATGATTPLLTLNVGTAANTVAAGDDARITGAFQSATGLGGDLSGNLPSPTVSKIQGRNVVATAPTINQVLKFDGTNWAPSADAGITVESDPLVFAFAKTALPTCAIGEVLKSNGTSFSCVTDTTGGAPADASYAAKGIVQFNTDAATSGVSVVAGVATVNAGTGANQIVKLDGTAKLPAVDGSQLTNVAVSGANVSGNISGNATGFTGSLAGDVSGTQASTVVNKIKGYGLDFTVAPTNGQVLKYNGTSWVAAADSAGSGTVTSVSSANAYLSVATGTTTPLLTLNVGTAANTVAAGDDARITGAFQSATVLGGDLSGSLPNPTVSKIQGRNVVATLPTSGQVLTWNNTLSQWEPSATPADSTKVAKTGDTMTGLLVLSADPAAALGAATKQYVDGKAIAGDVSGTLAASSVDKIKGYGLDFTVAPTNGQVLKYNGTSWVPSVDGGITAEIDPLVFAFAKTALPNCLAGQVLKSDGNSFSCVTDTTGGAPADASYAAKGIVQFNTDVVTSGVSVVAGVATVNTGVAANQIVKLDGTAKLPAVDGSQLTNVAVSGANVSGNISGNATGFTGSLAGDVSGTQAATIVNKIRGVAVTATAPTNGQVLKYDGTNWAPAADSTAFPLLATTSTAAAPAYSFVGSASTGIYNPITNAIAFSTAGTERIRIDSSGKIGIGTSAPTSALDLSGAFTFQGMAAPAVSPIGGGRIYYDSAANKFKVSQNAGVYVDLVGGGSGTVTSVSSANAYLSVATGTTTPQLTLNVGTAANTVAAGDDARITGAFQSATVLGGDLSGSLPNPTVSKIQGRNVVSTLPTAGQVLTWNNTLSQWEPSAAPADSTKVAKTGDTMTGLLVLSADPSAALGAATKQYVDGKAIAGDVSGTLAASSVDKIKGIGIDFTVAPTNGQVLKYNGTNWTAQADNSSGGISTINGDASSAQTFSIVSNTSSTLPVITHVSPNHEINIPPASGAGVTAGLISNTQYNKFNNASDEVINATPANNINTLMKRDAAGSFSAAVANLSEVRLASSGFSVGFRSPATLPQTTIWELPQIDGSTGSILSTNGSGQLSWISRNVGSTEIIDNSIQSIDIQDSTIADIDISGTAAISRSKIAVGAANKLVINNSAGNLSDSANLHYDSTNSRLGIGTNTPATDLHVFNSLGAYPLQIQTDNSVSGIKLIRAGGVGGTIEAQVSGNMVINAGLATSADIFINGSNGNVGIGLSAPITKFEVNGAIRVGSHPGGTCSLSEANIIQVGGTGNVEICNGITGQWEKVRVAGCPSGWYAVKGTGQGIICISPQNTVNTDYRASSNVCMEEGARVCSIDEYAFVRSKATGAFTPAGFTSTCGVAPGTSGTEDCLTSDRFKNGTQNSIYGWKYSAGDILTEYTSNAALKYHCCIQKQ